MTSNHNNLHIPVLIQPIIENFKNQVLDLNKDKDDIIRIFDGTLGGGGYIIEFAKLLLNSGYTKFEITGVDLDIVGIERVKEILEDKEYALIQDKIKFINDNFKNAIKTFPERYFDLIVLDLGFSSNQLEIEDRGLSYLKGNQILDMRFDTSFNTVPLWQKFKSVKGPKELTKILFNSSGEKFSAKIADHILAYIHEKGELKYVNQLVEIVIGAIPKQLQKNKYSILSRIWQALRIWVNDELNSLSEFLPYATNQLKHGGICAIVSFHSLEDKIVTKYFRTACTGIELDDYGNKEFFFEHLTKRPIEPTTEEIEANNRSRSGILRILKKL
jgi:16S rRNA (cytosine1402-N4)-methyltransferase